MTPSPASGSENDVDSKLDSLISRIQSLSGDVDPQRPKQQPRLASNAGPSSQRPSISRPSATPGSGSAPNAVPAHGPGSAALNPAAPHSAGNPLGGGSQHAAVPRSKPAATAPHGPRPQAFSAGTSRERLPYGFTPSRDEPWRPAEPDDAVTAGVNETILEAIIYRFLANIGEAEGRKIADQVKLPFRMVEPLLTRLKMEQNVAYKSSTATNDYVYILTESGRQIVAITTRIAPITDPVPFHWRTTLPA